ncbi:MAG: transcriptional regulator DeoR family [Herbinix sp.]|jgi:predicted DNA-binding transcriptional regulator YafY|nr:transcriptional regulator DeoR family [Herbinix sp.]
MQIGRLFEIVYILMNKKNTTAKELCEHFEVSQRTIYRDIETLCQSGIPIYTTKGKGGGIALMDNFVLNKSVLSEKEQNEILTALGGFKAATNADSDQVINKLGALFGNKSSDWIEVDFSNWNNNELDKSKFNQLKEAILKHNLLSFHYNNSGGQESSRCIEPYKLVFRGQAWYLFGYCLDKEDSRYFKITRIRDLEVKEEKFTPNSAKHKHKEEPSEAASYPMIPAVLRIDAKMAFRIYDEFPAENITKASDGSFLIRTLLHGGSWLTGYLMSYEDHLEILEPLQLREEIIHKLKKSLSKYDI